MCTCRQCSDTNQNIKRLVYCQYRTQSLMFLSDEGPTLKTLDFTFYRIVSIESCLGCKILVWLRQSTCMLM